jgi:ornithine carbamoyltransferase
MKKDLLTLKDLTKEDILNLIKQGLEIKKSTLKNVKPLEGHTIGLIFDKASTRTRVSFEVAIHKLGADAIFLTPSDTQIARGEPMKDTARVLSSYLDGLIYRTYSQKKLEELAKWSSIPVINALTDLYHPCQVLSDLMTIDENRDSLDTLIIAWIGDGNNVANSWINAANILEFNLTMAFPEGYLPNPDILANTSANVKLVDTPQEAASNANIIYTDVWASMGKEDETELRIKDFNGWQVNQSLIDLADKDVMVMHCLPAHRGEEITDDVMEGSRSIIFSQAENKLYMHQAILKKFIKKI